MAGVSEWSAVADENTTVDGINIAEHCPAKNMNDALRAVMAALKNKCDALDSTDNTLRRGAIIGEIRWFAMSTPPTGWLVCNGAAVGTSDYVALFAAIGKTFTPRLTSTDPDLENPEYRDPTVFRLPNLMGKVPWGSTSVGTVIDAGAPDIAGSFTMNDNVCVNDAALVFVNNTGCFYVDGSGNRAIATQRGDRASTDNRRVTFSASGSNDIYGNSDTVQPPPSAFFPVSGMNKEV